MHKISYELEKNVAIITLNSPPANALSSSIIDELELVLNEIESANKAKVIILKGEGRFFSAGADIKEFTSLQSESDYEQLARRGQKLFDRIERFNIPVIAAIHGAALGGGLELAMSCHIRIVTETAKLGLPELTLGIIPGFAGTQRLPLYVGAAKAYEMILTGEPISGKEAYELRLANLFVAKDEEIFTEAMKLATKIANKSKLSINKVMELIPFAKQGDFAAGVLQEAKAFSEIFGSDDAKEGVAAFLEKRPPKFKGE